MPGQRRSAEVRARTVERAHRAQTSPRRTERRPLPAGAQFFEEKFVLGALVRQFALGLLLIVVGPALVMLFLDLLSETSRLTYYFSDNWKYIYYIGGAGVVCLIGGVAPIWFFLPKY